MSNDEYVGKTYENRKFRVKIIQDVDPESPRTWNNLGTMVCWHPDYNLGDEHSWSDPADWADEVIGEAHLNEIYKAIDACFENHQLNTDRYKELQKELDKARSIPNRMEHFDGEFLTLFLLDHSGLWMRANSGWAEDAAGWDTSRVGFIYCTKEKIIEEYGEDTPETRKKTREILHGEVATYSQYLENDVWGYTIEVRDKDGDWEEDNACWGFYGGNPKENGMWDCWCEDVRQCVDSNYVINSKGCFKDKQYELPLEVAS